MIKTEYARMSMLDNMQGGGERPEQLLFIHLKETVNDDDKDENMGAFNKVKTIIIEEITFSRSYFLYYILIGCGVVLYYGIYIIFLQIKKQTRKDQPGSPQVHLPAIHLEVETYEEEDVRKIMNIFQEHIFDPEFSIHVVYNKTGQARARVAALIKEKYGLSFKQLMNAIRLNEAKRLLVESDLKIYDIAFKIGYNNNTYFCKLFKKEFGLTPKEFRYQHIS
jgi:AraC-like DNA-binding protein